MPGDHCSYQTSKPENDLMGRFANGAFNRVLVQVDEVKSLHDYSDRLKDLMTNPILNYEKKGKDTTVMANLTNLILTSNNANALTVTADERRYVPFHCSALYKVDPTYFNLLDSHFDQPEVARAFYQHCRRRDVRLNEVVPVQPPAREGVGWDGGRVEGEREGRVGASRGGVE